MNAITTPTLEFGRDEAFDVTVNLDRSPTHRPAHSFVPTKPAGRPRGICRAWPSGHGIVYVVDTYPRLAALAQTILEKDGFSTCAFDDRSMAWHAFAFARPKPLLLITDNLDGNPAARELFDRCRSIAPGLKTLLVDHRQSFGRQTPDWTDGLVSLPYCASVLIKEVRRLCTTTMRSFA
jgi:hypothetical protein